MALADSEKMALKALFFKVADEAQSLGCIAMESLFAKHPDTKSHFSHMDLTPGSRDLKAHGGRIIHAINDALRHYDNLQENMLKLRQLHSDKLRLNLETIQLLCPCLLDAIVERFPEANREACGKFLNTVAVSLVSS